MGDSVNVLSRSTVESLSRDVEGGQVFLFAGLEGNNGILEKAPSLDLLFPVTVFTSFSSIRLKGCRYQVYKYLFFLPSK